MIWHIFRKDLRLLWPPAAFVAFVQLLNAGLLIGGGPFLRSSMGEMTEFGWVSNGALPGVELLGLVVLVMAVIQQDKLPGTTQDWLIRPIPTRELLLAKLLFVGLAGLLPILAADLVMGLTEHLKATDVVAGSLTRSAALFCLVCLPAALIATVTRTLIEALVFVIAVGVLLIIEFIVLSQIHFSPPGLQSGYRWIAAPILVFLNLAALLILLPLQFRWRSTNRVRWIVAAYFCLFPAVFFVPSDMALQIGRALDPRSSDSEASITLDTTRKITFTLTPSYPGRTGSHANVRLPIIVSNLGPGNRLNVDRIKLHAIDAEHPASESGSLSEALSGVYPFGYILDRSADTSKASTEIELTVPFDAFSAARASQSRIELELSATRLRLTAEKPLQAVAGGSIDDHGRCSMQDSIRFGRERKAVYCVSARPIGNCFSAMDRLHPLRNPFMAGAFRCMGASYAPWPLPLWRDAYYTALLGMAVDWQQQISSGSPGETPKNSDVIISNYVPDIHLVRSLSFQFSSAIERARVANRSVDGTGLAARFASPAGVVADKRGNMFIVDSLDSVIRKVTSAGEVSTFAGMAQQAGWTDGKAQDARFKDPRGIAIDSADNLFIADTGNGLIRKITPAGMVSTLTGSSGDAGNTAGPLRFTNPRGVVCAPDGSLYVIDSNAVEGGNPVIRRVSPAGVVSTVAGPNEPVGDIYEGGVVLEGPDGIDF